MAEPTLTVDAARQLILDHHNIAVGEDDPILIAVTLHAAFMADTAAMLRMHEASQRDAFAQVAGEVSHSVSKTTEGLKNALLDGAVTSVLNGIAQHAEIAGKTHTHARSGLIAHAVLTALQWLSLVAFYFIVK